MYAMCGKLIAKPSQRGQLVEILLRAAQTVGQLSSCRLYAVNEDLADEVTVWVMEIWDDKEAHDASLKDERVRALIAAVISSTRTPSRSGSRVRSRMSFHSSTRSSFAIVRRRTRP